MREIKFRAWLKEEKKMSDVVRIDFQTRYVYFDEMIATLDYLRVCPFDSVELMQYTGFHDKNGKEIYEGDIVCYNRKRNLPNYEVVYYVVKFDEQTASFQRYENNQEKIVVPTFDKNSFVKISGKENLSKDSMNECEVIGNIYDNPELLENK